MTTPYTFYYNAQIRKYISQFLRVFAGFQTQDGVDRNADSKNDMRPVNIRYGDIDRVMAAILQNNSESFVNQKLPVLAGVLTGVQLDPQRRMTKHHAENISYPKAAGGVGVTQRLIGTPIKLNMDLNICASNTDQLFQILEQILLLFNPALDIQRSSGGTDWTYISKVELVSINNQQNFPIGQQRKVIVWNLSFTVDAWVNFAELQSSGVIEQIITNIHDESINFPGVLLDTSTTTDTTKEGP